MKNIVTTLSVMGLLAMVGLGVLSHIHQTVVSLEDFTASVSNGDSSMVVGVYKRATFALKVIPQPEGNFAYLPDTEELLVQLAQAEELYGNLGLAAHNNLAGKYIAELTPGDIINIIYGDGTIFKYEIINVKSYQAFLPDDLYSDYKDLEDGRVYSSSQLFEKAFGGENQIGLITCISQDDISTWGRIVVVGVPVE